jgi:tetratricopeptide (TPR) repeat protein
MLRVCNFAWVGLALSLGVVGCGAHAGAGGSGGAAGQSKHAIGEKAGTRLQAAAGHIESSQWDQALEELDKASEGEPNPYEQAKILQMKAQVFFNTEKVEQGVQALEQAIALEAMPEEEQLQVMYVLGRGYGALERFKESADLFTKWLERTKEPTAENYYQVADAYARAGRFEEALPLAKKAVEGSDKPQEEWYRVLAWVHFELKQEAELAAVLEQTVKAFPKKEWYLQLASAYQAQGEHQKALQTLTTAYGKGMLTEETDVVNYSVLHLKGGEPLKGAALLQKQIEARKVAKNARNMELLARLYIEGKDTERGTAALEVVGKQVSSGQVFFELARVHFQKEAWEPARDALARAVTTGGLKSPGDAQLMLGITHYKMTRKDAALASLEQAKKYPPTTKCAEQWIKAAKKGRKDATGECATSAIAEKNLDVKSESAKAAAATNTTKAN